MHCPHHQSWPSTYQSRSILLRYRSLLRHRFLSSNPQLSHPRPDPIIIISFTADFISGHLLLISSHLLQVPNRSTFTSTRPRLSRGSGVLRCHGLTVPAPRHIE